VSVLFNFSHNGVTPEAPTAFTDLEAFANNTFTRELDDLRAVLDAVDRRMLPEAAPVDPGRIGLMGHSRGGGTAVLQAARDERVWALATWSAVAHFVERFTDAQVEDWRTQGYTTVQNSRTGQTMRMNRVLYDDAQAHRRALDIPAAAAAIERPWLVVHARDDDSVAFEAAETLAEAGGETATLLPAEGGHTFGGAHPHDGAVPETLETVWKRTQAFFREHL
jgi:dienelactone hydrolase